MGKRCEVYYARHQFRDNHLYQPAATRQAVAAGLSYVSQLLLWGIGVLPHRLWDHDLLVLLIHHARRCDIVR